MVGPGFFPRRRGNAMKRGGHIGSRHGRTRKSGRKADARHGEEQTRQGTFFGEVPRHGIGGDLYELKQEDQAKRETRRQLRTDNATRKLCAEHRRGKGQEGKKEMMFGQNWGMWLPSE